MGYRTALSPLSRPAGHAGAGMILMLLVCLFLTPLQATAATECEEPDGKDTYGLEEPGWEGSLDYCLVSPPPTPTPQPTATPTPVVGKWRYNWWTDSLTGQKRENARLVATSRTGYGDEVPTLYVRCDVGNPQWEVYIAWNEFIGGDSPAVSYRVATEPVVAARWTASTDNEATFLPRGRVRPFLDVLGRLDAAGTTRFVVRVWRYDDQTITALWDIAGAQVAVQRLTARCTQ